MKDDLVEKWGPKDEWDWKIPETLDDVISLLRRRIQVHTYWRNWMRTGDERAVEASRYGVGTVESHQAYIDQYEGALRVLDAIEPAIRADERERCMRLKLEEERNAVVQGDTDD